MKEETYLKITCKDMNYEVKIPLDYQVPDYILNHMVTMEIIYEKIFPVQYKAEV